MTDAPQAGEFQAASAAPKKNSVVVKIAMLGDSQIGWFKFLKSKIIFLKNTLKKNNHPTLDHE